MNRSAELHVFYSRAVAIGVLLLALVFALPAAVAAFDDPAAGQTEDDESTLIERIEAQPLTAVDARSAALLLSGEDGGDFEGAVEPPRDGQVPTNVP